MLWRSKYLVFLIFLISVLAWLFIPGQTPLVNNGGPNSHSHLPLSPESVNSNTQPTPDLVETAGQKSEEPIEVISISESQSRTLDHRQGRSSQGYKSLIELHLDETSKNIKLEFNEPLDNFISLLFIGGEGQSEVQDIVLHYENGQSESAPTLAGEYFENDWYRSQWSGQKITAITLKGRSKSYSSRLSLVMQQNF